MNVELNDIHKTFGAVHANVGINMKNPAGTIQGILGKTRGKSTLMKILSGFIQPDQGEILWTASRSRSIPGGCHPAGRGYAPPGSTRFSPMRVIENFILGRAGGC